MKRGKKEETSEGFDGSKQGWMTRKMTDKAGKLKEAYVPSASKPSEASEYHDHYDHDAMMKREEKTRSIKPPRDNPKKTRGILKSEPRAQKGPTGSSGFLKHTQKGKI
jgi:hypothetical protein